MTDVNATQYNVLALVSGTEAINATQYNVIGGIKFPAPAINATQYNVLSIGEEDNVIHATQYNVLALVRGKVDNRKLRAWAFTLDGHDFYVLRLGELSTLVYDVLTQQWSEWISFGQTTWRAHIGITWRNVFIIGGDDATGTLWVLDPTIGKDADETKIERVVTGGLPMRNRDSVDCKAVYLTGSVGYPTNEGVMMGLRTSDDYGRSWVDHGAIRADLVGEYNFELSWRSLGRITAPGRIFEIYDDGVVARIDSLDMPDPE